MICIFRYSCVLIYLNFFCYVVNIIKKDAGVFVFFLFMLFNYKNKKDKKN
jgi:hypothetical protein